MRRWAAAGSSFVSSRSIDVVSMAQPANPASRVAASARSISNRNAAFCSGNASFWSVVVMCSFGSPVEFTCLTGCDRSGRKAVNDFERPVEIVCESCAGANSIRRDAPARRQRGRAVADFARGFHAALVRPALIGVAPNNQTHFGENPK